MTQPLRIGFMLWNGRVGGAERHTVGLASTIARLGMADAHVVFVDSAQPVLGAMAAEGYSVPVSELCLGRGRNLLLHSRQVGLHLRRLCADVIFAPVGGFAPLALRESGFAGVLVGVEHGAMMNRRIIPLRRRWLQSGSMLLTASSYDGYVAVSDVMAEHVRRGLGSEVLVATIPNGIDIAKYAPDGLSADADTLRIGVASRLVWGKGVREAILAVRPRIGGRVVKLRVAGDGPLRSELQQLACRRGIAANVEFLGMVRDMPTFWRGCDVAVHATNGVNESFCLAVVEAQASGLPAVVSRAGALPSVVVDGQTGTVVEPGDVDGLWQAICRYASDESLRVSHGVAAREHACRLFSLERVASEYVTVACDLVERRCGASEGAILEQLRHRRVWL